MLKIVKADERLAAPAKINIAIFGPSGVGKTTQARTLSDKATLFIDLEAGTLAVQDWKGDVLDIRAQSNEMKVHPWELARAIACYIGGPDPADPTGPYSLTAYQQYAQAFGDPAGMAKYDTVFWDSITVASRMCLDWSKRQPEAFSEKTGKPDVRGAYGLLGQEMKRWLTHIQHTAGKSVIVVGILDQVKDDFGRVTWEPQIEGTSTAKALPGIFDEVLTLSNLTTDSGQQYRAFVCHQDNPWAFPAKDRSGCLDLIEPPDLGALIAKIRKGKRKDISLTTNLPADKKE